MTSKMKKRGFKGYPNVHSIIGQGADWNNNIGFTYIPGFYKSFHQELFQDRQKRFLSPDKARMRSEKFRVATQSGQLVWDEELKMYVLKNGKEAKNVPYSPLGLNYPKGKEKFCKVKECYEEYMYIGEDGKPVKEEDGLKGISTMNELKKTMAALIHDYENGLIDDNQFRYRIYLMHMALLAMSDDPKNGEFAKPSKRKEAIKYLEEVLSRYGFLKGNKHLKKVSAYYKDMRKIVPGKGINTSTKVSEDQIIWLDAKGNEVPKTQAVYFLYKEPKTAGDYMHNRRVKTILSQKGINIAKYVENLRKKKKAKKPIKRRTKKKVVGFTADGTSEITAITQKYDRLYITNPEFIEEQFRNDLSNVFVSFNDAEKIKQKLHTLYEAITETTIPDDIKERLIKIMDDEIMIRGWDRREVIY